MEPLPRSFYNLPWIDHTRGDSKTGWNPADDDSTSGLEIDMSSLTLVRHAQASFFADDYDQLSEQGERQSAALGEYWLGRDHTFDEIYVGPRVRHRRTAEIIGDCYHSAGRDWPTIVPLPDFDEHHVDQLVRMEGASLADDFPELAPLSAQFREAQGETEKQRAFQLFFEALTGYWVAGKAGDEIESWQQFCHRVQHGLDHVISSSDRSGRSVAIFTSVGPITVILQQALECPDKTALETGWRTWNCSLTEFVFSGNRLTLDCFNSLPHLTDMSEWTYR